MAWGGFQTSAAFDLSLSSRERLVRSLQGERSVEARLSWELAYAPFSAGSAAAAFDRERVEAEIDIARAVEERATPKTLGDRGIVHLLRHHFDRAVEDLERALRLAPDDARLLNDLAAVLLARGQAEKDLDDLVRALDAAERAVELDPQLAPALFNRALALEHLFLAEPARLAWEEYLAADPRSAWAEEARRHLEILAAPPAASWEELRGVLDNKRASDEAIRRIVSAFPQEAQQYVEENLLDAWARAIHAGRHENAACALASARRIGKALAALGEHLPADTVAAIDRAGTDSRMIAALAAAHLDYRAAQRLRFNWTEARPRFERALQTFDRVGSPSVGPTFYLAVEQYQRNDLPLTLSHLRGLLDNKNYDRYPGLRCRAYWLLGLVHLMHGRPADSLAAFRVALSIAHGTGALQNEAIIHSLLAENFRCFGESRERSAHAYTALTLTPSTPTSNIRQLVSRLNILTEVAILAERNYQWRSAEHFHNESVHFARAGKAPMFLMHKLLQRSRLLHGLSDFRGARNDLDEARRLIAEIPYEHARLRMEVEILLVEAELYSSTLGAARLQAASRSLDSHDSQEVWAGCRDSSSRHLTRIRAALSLGNVERAEEDLQRGIEEIERQWENISDERFQISFLDQSDDLLDEMIRLQLRRPRGAESALDFAERGRARILLDHLELIENVWSKPLTSRGIRDALPEGVAIIEYRMLDDRLLTWIIRRDDIELEVQAVSAPEVDDLVTDLRSGLFATDAGDSFVSASGALYDLLVRPILPHLATGDQLLFVPDESLHMVPFRALLDRFTGRYLLQDWIVAVAPSASFYVKTLERDRALASRSRQQPTMLSIGNPRPNTRVAPGLSDLPQAEREAAAAASHFAGSVVLTGEKATETDFLSAAGQHDLVHFGGHAVENEDYPFLSHLLMAPEEPRDSGLLFAHELYRHRFDRPRLAVLAACETGAGQIRSEGVLSIARAFLAAGVPTVVASLWNVEDRATSRLFETFYERLHQGDDPAAALRRAQLDLLEQGEPVHDWAAFEVIGGVAPGWRLGGAAH